MARVGWQSLKSSKHGDLAAWFEAISEIPEGDGRMNLDCSTPLLGGRVDDPAHLRETLIKLHPWRKGPLALGGVDIDTEWRSDWKWDRLGGHLDLRGQRILDIGCGNGYFGLRMLGAGAELVVGLDPTMVFVMQWLAMKKLCPLLNSYVLPIGIEELPQDTGGFDSVFSMGVLYHRKQPIEHLARLKKCARKGGQIILETLILKGMDKNILTPRKRYARMRNVHAIPSLPVLVDWLGRAGMEEVRVLDVSTTTTEEQRSTDWMTFESLDECLNDQNSALTVEGYPAPLRAALLIQV